MSRFLPLIIVLGLFAVFGTILFDDERNPKELRSAMLGKPVPNFQLQALYGDGMLTQEDLKSGKPLLVNFFASWCVPCRAEHQNLMYLARDKNIPIIGIAYKDKQTASKEFIEALGNPYTKTAMDSNGRLAIDFGVSGVPETFLITGNGLIYYRHWGPIVGDSMEKSLLPKLREISQ